MKKWDMPRGTADHWQIVQDQGAHIPRFRLYRVGESVIVPGKKQSGIIVKGYNFLKKQYYYVVRLMDGTEINTLPTEFYSMIDQSEVPVIELKRAYEIKDDWEELDQLESQYMKIMKSYGLKDIDEAVFYLTENLLMRALNVYEWVTPTFVTRNETYEEFLYKADLPKKISGDFATLNIDIRGWFYRANIYVWYQDNGLIESGRLAYNSSDVDLGTYEFKNSGSGLWRRARAVHLNGRSAGLYDDPKGWGYFFYLIPCNLDENEIKAPSEDRPGFWMLPGYEGIILEDDITNRRRLTLQNLRLVSDHLPETIPNYYKSPEKTGKHIAPRDLRIGDKFKDINGSSNYEICRW